MKDRNSRQSFLGERFENALRDYVIGVVGLGGGGSHIIQQLAHIGFQNFVICDPDIVENSNLTRLVGGVNQDAVNAVQKVAVAVRMIRGLQPDANIELVRGRWQDEPQSLRPCHVIFGCVDTFAGREELEAHARRYLASYIDLGMDVWAGQDGQAVMGGQVALSIPGRPCLKCLGILTKDQLAQEALTYGAAGGRPQVVWANGVLASIAVGRLIDLVADWSGVRDGPLCWAFDGNRLTVTEHWKSRAFADRNCEHYPSLLVGPPVFSSF